MFGNVAIIGLGFMGGSFALAIKHKNLCKHVVGIDISRKSIEEGLKLGIVDEGDTNINMLKGRSQDLIVISSPVGTFIDIALKIAPILSKDTIITDLGSVKGNLVYEMEKILGNKFVGGHPIAGTEKSGVTYSVTNLFDNKKFIITPTENTNKEAIELVKKLWERIGSKVEIMDPFVHDYVFGVVSHLPHAVAFSLIDVIDKLSEDIDLFQYPGGGFKDFTRIAASNPTMWRDIFIKNKLNILKSIDSYIASLSYLRMLIDQEKEEKLLLYLKKLRNKRLSIYED